MWKRKRGREEAKKEKELKTHTEQTIDSLFNTLAKSNDFKSYSAGSSHYIVSYLKTMCEPKLLNQSILPILTKYEVYTLAELKNKLPVEATEITKDPAVVQEKMMKGYISIQLRENAPDVLLLPAITVEGREVSIPEVEFSVVGPKEAFVESLDKNMNLMRKRLTLPQLTLKEVSIGKITKTRVGIVYIDGIADPDNVTTVLQRLEDIEYDQIIDSSFITQMIADNSTSPFPQLLDTERPDRAVEVIVEGKIVIIVDGSPHVLTCPTTIVEFFSSSDDYFLPWPLASVFRLIRLFAVFFSVLSTSLYVAILTYHHEMIPEELMSTIVSSRADIPFPPILEVVILELTIELLREAGARLPTKIGQTIGIVGGIVIGTAAVDAGLTSNVLLIIVALAALASFTTPVYQIGNTIRLIRFPFLMGAQLWGLIGVSMVMVFYVGHLIKLKSIGRPFFAPLYPLRFRDLRDAFIRLPFNKQSERPLQTRPVDPVRFNVRRASEKRDVDE
ncbi:spore germination protein [Halobacillus sp. A5]|uniref:spore germination protein n=1 Tax=Halobacillus sp. A5 TaxID=2880263 RepID=UPI0020A6A2E2|nr:spore germination protein [Halobacillus sp. A5]MCP3026828.1 spore germination protein [Halobacillus sp. A5]